MQKLLFIKNLKELNYIKRNLAQLLRTHRIIVVCSLPWLELQAQGFSVEMASDYLSEDGLRNILREARTLSKEWYKPFAHSLDYRGINLGELVRLDLIWFFRELITSYSVIQRLIDAHKPTEIALFADLDFPNLSASRYNGKSDIFTAAVLCACEKSKIPVYKLRFKWQLKRKLNLFWRRLKRRISRYTPIILFFCRYLKRLSKNIIYYKGLNRIPLNSFSKVPQNKLAVALGSSFELLVLKNIVKTLSDTKKFNLALVNLEPVFKIPRANNRSGLDGEDSLKFISLDDFNLSIMPQEMQIFSLLKNARKYLESENNGLLNSPNLSVQFDFLWSDYFYEAVSMVDKVYYLYRKWNPDLVIVANAIGYTQRILVKLAKTLGVKSVTAPHGWVGDIDEYEFESDLFLAWGELSRKQLIEEFNKSAENIAAVGALQFDRFIPLLRQFRDAKEIKDKFGLRLGGRVILILTGGMAQSVFCATDMQRFFAFWEFMKSFIVRHPEIDFILRPHPTEELADWYRQMVKSSSRTNFKIIEEEKLDAFLPAVDVGVSIGIPSTANYLCLLFGIPIIIFNGFDRTGLFSTDEAWNEDNGLLVTKKEKDLGNFILQLLNGNNFRNETISKELSFLDKSLLIRDGKAGERILEEIEKLCR